MPANVHNKTDTVKPSAKSSTLAKEGGAAEPNSGRKEELSTKQFCSTKPTVHWVSNGWTCMDWEGADGQPGGYVVTNGQSAMFFDETGNMTFSTGVPGQSGCGGKLVFNSADQIHNAQGTISIHAKGPKDATRTADSRGSKGESTKESHAYSVYAEGKVAIEAQGDSCDLKGDNITINALKTLTLKAGEAVNIEVGDGNGKMSIYCGDYNLNTSFNNKTIGSADYTDGAGEKTLNTTQPGSVEATNTIGTINRSIKGNYYLGVAGHYNLNALANINLKSTTGGIGIDVVGNQYTKVGGTRTEKILGVVPSVGDKPPVVGACWDLKLGPGKQSFKAKLVSGIEVKSALGVNSFKLNGVTDVKITGTLTVKALTIFLN
jgi:hypothetical protein